MNRTKLYEDLERSKDMFRRDFHDQEQGDHNESLENEPNVH